VDEPRRRRSSTSDFEESLPFGHGQLDVASDEIGESTGVGDSVEDLVPTLPVAAALAQLGGARSRISCTARRRRDRLRSPALLLHGVTTALR